MVGCTWMVLTVDSMFYSTHTMLVISGILPHGIENSKSTVKVWSWSSDHNSLQKVIARKRGWKQHMFSSDCPAQPSICKAVDSSRSLPGCSLRTSVRNCLCKMYYCLFQTVTPWHVQWRKEIVFKTVGNWADCPYLLNIGHSYYSFLPC